MEVALAVPGERDLRLLADHLSGAPDSPPASTPGLGSGVCERLAELRRTGAAERELERCRRLGLQVVAYGHDAYPASLYDLVGPPCLLYLSGRGPWPPELPVTLVGARKATGLGRAFARELGEEVVERGGSVVSGLALGIDQACTQGGLDAGGACYAVLACGLDRVYPPGARPMAERIAVSGRILSEMPIGTPPLRAHFHRRNRLLAALSPGLIVVEADVRSGSLITARHALDLGRDIYAVPGSIDRPASRGTNRLIRDGAHPILERSDVELLLPGSRAPGSREPILELLSSPKTPEQLSESSGRPLDQLLVRLVEWEIDGAVERLASGQYRRT